MRPPEKKKGRIVHKGRVVFAAACLTLMSAAAAPSTLVRHATILTASGPQTNADILIENGKIAAIGPALPAPAGARIVEAKGRTVTPGLFALSSEIGPSSNIADTDDPASAVVARARRLGVTRVLTLPSGCMEVFCGLARILHMGGGFEPSISDHAGVWVRLEANGKLTNPDLWNKVQNTLHEAREFQSGRGAFFRPGDTQTTRAEVESLQGAIAGAAPLLVEAEHSDVMTRIARFAEAEKLKMVLVDRGSEAWKIAALLAALHIPVAIPVDGGVLTAAAGKDAMQLDRAGVRVGLFAVMGNGASLARAATGLKAAGLKEATAIAALTGAFAPTFGMSGWGVLAKGKEADLVIWSADPAAAAAQPETVFVRGEDVLHLGVHP